INVKMDVIVGSRRQREVRAIKDNLGSEIDLYIDSHGEVNNVDALTKKCWEIQQRERAKSIEQVIEDDKKREERQKRGTIEELNNRRALKQEEILQYPYYFGDKDGRADIIDETN